MRMTLSLALLLSLVPFYLLGAFPTGKLIARVYGVTLEQHGSGNVGATNVTRVIGKRAGLFTLLGDVGKGWIGMASARFLFGFDHPEVAILFGWIVVAGHCFSIPRVLRGGKGVATALGVLIALSPLLTLYVVTIFVTVATLTKIVSVASITAACAAPLLSLFLFENDSIFYGLVGIAFLIVLRHYENIIRLIEGREKKWGAKAQEAASSSASGDI